MWSTKIDKPFFWIFLSLVVSGFFIFISASLGIHVREGVEFSRIVINQLFFGLIMGSVALLIGARIPLHFWQRYSFYFFILSLFLTLLVFVPGLGFEHGGAQRWINVGPLSFQPSETIKVAAVLYFATLLTSMKKRVTELKFGFGILIALLSSIGFILLLQPDTDTFFVISAGLCAMFLVAGGKWKHLGSLAGAGVVCLALLLLVRPYLMERIHVFINPASDPQGAGYQIQQSLIAVGSGGVMGRGMGQSVQKFNYLPEPIGDSIFAVFAEEWGFIGCFVLISLFAGFIFRGFTIANRTRTPYGMYVATGIVTIIGIQSLINIASMLSIFPLAGIPLTFVSKGGTSLLISMGAVGILLNISRDMVKARTKRNSKQVI